MAHPTYRVDFRRTDDLGHVMVRTVTSGEQVTMVDDDGTSCLGTVVLHSPDLGLLLIRPEPGSWETVAVADAAVADAAAVPDVGSAPDAAEELPQPRTPLENEPLVGGSRLVRRPTRVR